LLLSKSVFSHITNRSGFFPDFCHSSWLLRQRSYPRRRWASNR
jgi:hypothetical protein